MDVFSNTYPIFAGETYDWAKPRGYAPAFPGDQTEFTRHSDGRPNPHKRPNAKKAKAKRNTAKASRKKNRNKL